MSMQYNKSMRLEMAPFVCHFSPVLGESFSVCILLQEKYTRALVQLVLSVFLLRDGIASDWWRKRAATTEEMLELTKIHSTTDRKPFSTVIFWK